jgi:hypothetical protein
MNANNFFGGTIKQRKNTERVNVVLLIALRFLQLLFCSPEPTAVENPAEAQ